MPRPIHDRSDAGEAVGDLNDEDIEGIAKFQLQKDGQEESEQAMRHEMQSLKAQHQLCSAWKKELSWPFAGRYHLSSK